MLEYEVTINVAGLMLAGLGIYAVCVFLDWCGNLILVVTPEETKIVREQDVD